MDFITLHPIGVIRSPHTVAEKTPIQPAFAAKIAGTVEVAPAFAAGLRDLEGFSHIWLLYLLDRARDARLMVKPFLEDTEHGVFATRSPRRPNPIGLSVVRLVARSGCTLAIEDVDILDGTPLLDIKPYVGRFDRRDDVRCGWLDAIDEEDARTRGRREHRA